MATTTGTYEGQTMSVTWGIISPYSATPTDELIQGYGGSDTIYGNALDNYIFGDQRADKGDFDLVADGADILYGYGGDDVIDPGTGFNNYVNGGGDNDTLDYRYATPGQALTADIEAGSAYAGTYGSTQFVNVENVFGTEAGRNFLYGDDGANEIHGGALNDRLYGRGGKDLILGFDGHDTLKGGHGSDKLKGGTGDDKVFGRTGNDTVIGGSGNDTLKGGNGNDEVIGAYGADTMYGGSGNDHIEGRNGRDVILAGSGDDTLYGGSAVDRFVFNKHSDSNRIMDFETRDKLQFDSGAQSIFDLKFTDTKGGLWIEFGSVDIFLKGIDIGDLDFANFIF